LSNKKRNLQNITPNTHYPKKKEEMLLLTLLLFVQLAVGGWWSSLKTQLESRVVGLDLSETCGFTRADALICFKQYVDINKDEIISADEFERAKHLYLPWRVRKAMQLASKAGFDVSLETVMEGCDVDRDGKFTVYDWMNSEKTCLPGKMDLCMIKSVCDIAAGEK
jgi:hypothetical protein